MIYNCNKVLPNLCFKNIASDYFMINAYFLHKKDGKLQEFLQSPFPELNFLESLLTRALQNSLLSLDPSHENHMKSFIFPLCFLIVKIR